VSKAVRLRLGLIEYNYEEEEKSSSLLAPRALGNVPTSRNPSGYMTSPLRFHAVARSGSERPIHGSCKADLNSSPTQGKGF